MSVAISKTTFLSGLIVAILASSAMSTAVSMQWARGPKGDKGDQGDTGLQGSQGIQGPPGVFTIENMSGWLPAPAYDSGWIIINVEVEPIEKIFHHNLGTTDVIVYAYRKYDWLGINHYSSMFDVYWYNLTETTINVYPVGTNPDQINDSYRVLIWKIAQS